MSPFSDFSGSRVPPYVSPYGAPSESTSCGFGPSTISGLFGNPSIPTSSEPTVFSGGGGPSSSVPPHRAPSVPTSSGFGPSTVSGLEPQPGNGSWLYGNAAVQKASATSTSSGPTIMTPSESSTTSENDGFAERLMELEQWAPICAHLQLYQSYKLKEYFEDKVLKLAEHHPSGPRGQQLDQLDRLMKLLNGPLRNRLTERGCRSLMDVVEERLEALTGIKMKDENTVC